MKILFAVIFVVAVLDLRRQYGWGLWEGAQAILAKVVAVFSLSQQGPSRQGHPRRVAAWFGFDGSALELQTWSAASQQDWEASKSGIVLSRAEPPTARTVWVLDRKYKTENLSGLIAGLKL